MYIPTGYFSTKGTLIASGGFETTQWISGSYIYKSHIFTDALSETSSFNITAGKSDEISVLIVGGGGGRGVGQVEFSGVFYAAGAGGAGGLKKFVNQSFSSGSYIVNVGGAGANAANNTVNGTNGRKSGVVGNSFSQSVAGGGGGGKPRGNGSNGGSGGGAGGGFSPGTGIVGQGFNGGEDFTNVIVYGGSGGGSSQAGQVLGIGGSGSMDYTYYGLPSFYAGGGGYSSGDSATRGVGSIGRGSTVTAGSGTVIISYPFKRVDLFRNEYVRFQSNPSYPTSSLYYVQSETGILQTETIYSGVSYDRCVVSGSQWLIVDNQRYALDTPIKNTGGTRTILSTTCP